MKIRVEGIRSGECLTRLIKILEQIDPWRLQNQLNVEYDFIALHILSVYFEQVLFYSSQEQKM